mgnify:CR=1 FL=1
MIKQFLCKSDVVASLSESGEFWGSTTDFSKLWIHCQSFMPIYFILLAFNICILYIITGKLECDEYTTEDSLYIAKILAEINSQIGAKV